MEPREPTSMPLHSALMRAASASAVRELEILEAELADAELEDLHVLRLTGIRYDPTLATRRHPEERRAIKRAIVRCFLGVVNEMRQQVENGDLHLSGVLIQPEARTQREPVPGVWAAAMQFDFHNNGIECLGRRYVSVRASSTPFSISAEGATVQEAPSRDGKALRPGDVPALDDETIFALLNEHAERVINSADAKLLDAFKIKVSFMPILRRKMEHRFDTGETLPTLGKETAALKDWIATKVPSHQVPTAKSIANAIGSRYRPPKA